MKQIFDNYVEISFEGRQPSALKRTQFEYNYKSHFPAQGAAVTLDIGIGRGEMLACMRDWGCDYQGIDISPSTVALCQSLQLRCEVVADPAEWLRQHPGAFDVITCLDVLEHVPREQVIGFLEAMRVALKSGGRAIIQVPNLQSPYGYLHHFNDFTHVSGFVEHSLTQVLLAGGFRRPHFSGFEEVCGSGVKATIKKVLRYFYRRAVRLARTVNANPNPEILDPVFYCVVGK